MQNRLDLLWIEDLHIDIALSQDEIQYLGKARNNLWWPGQVQNLSLR